MKRRGSVLALFGPGLLVAATGVGAGDLATASIAGSKLGVSILWAVLLGAFLKYVLTEGLARWQLVTGQTLLEGVVGHLGRPAAWLFLVYLVIWSFAVGRALASACGVTAFALLPIFDTPETGKIVFGTLHAVVGGLLVLVGGYRLFERIMSAAILLMFVTVVLTAWLLRPRLGALLSGLVPTLPPDPESLLWTVALLGGIGGTVTLLCYGYWIREEGREGAAALKECRIDLASGYTATAVFGLAMVVVGATVEIEGGGAGLLVSLADRLRQQLGGPLRLIFLLGAWGAVMSSLLGVWQSVPYLFADLWGQLTTGEEEARPVAAAGGRPYRGFLLYLVVVSTLGLLASFVRIQVVYAVLGALFIPMLALALLLLNGRADLLGEEHRNRPTTGWVLGGTLLLFVAFGIMELLIG